MKYIFLLVTLLAIGFAMGQAPPGSDSIFSKYALRETGAAFTPGYYIGVWEKGIPRHITPVRHWNDHTAVIFIHTSDQKQELATGARISPVAHDWKLSPAAGYLKINNDQKQWILLGKNSAALAAAVNNIKGLRIIRRDEHTGALIVAGKWNDIIKGLLPLHELIFIDVLQAAHSEVSIIGYNRALHGINAVDVLIPGADGKGIVAGIKEQGIDTSDIDLWKRVLHSPIAAASTSYHANVIASIIGGAGNSYYDARGIAPGVRFFSSSFVNLFADERTILQAARVSVQNHSYGTVIQPFYGAEAASYDLLTWSDKTYIPVFSSGNQGSATAPSGNFAQLPGFANLTGNFKESKNSITVGAVDGNHALIASSSSGPMYDGRMAPQIVAHGPNGTSDAAAMVSGTIAVMQQVYADNHGSPPPASLIKAVLYNNADEINHDGPDHKTGFGLLNAYTAVNAIKKRLYDGGSISNGPAWVKTVSVPTDAAALKVTLSWTDTAAGVNNGKALSNDLDLEVIAQRTGETFLPWVLSSAPHLDSLQKAARRGRDSLHTAEQVSIRLPAAGDYEIRVKGRSLSTTSLPFHISWSIDTLNRFAFTSPVHPADLLHETGDPVTIRWETGLADTTIKGNLFQSGDGGSSWHLLAGGLPLHRKHAQVFIQDTAAVIQLKMETPYGAFTSPLLAQDKKIGLKVDFNCADSVRLSWNSQKDATHYRLFALTDSPYLAPVRIESDTFTVIHKSSLPFTVYAVQPLLASGLPTVRSLAQHIGLQGVHCFYQNLFYTIVDENKVRLVIQLSAPEYLDSIYFEKVSATGSLLRSYGGMRVSAPGTQYALTVDSLEAGITYLRVRIVLNNGVSVYTDTLPVLTSGTQQVWFYPNPVPKDGMIRYVVRQGVPAASALYLYDIQGRLLQSHSAHPGKINAAQLPSGMIFYRLVHPDGTLLQNGKLLILR